MRRPRNFGRRDLRQQRHSPSLIFVVVLASAAGLVSCARRDDPQTTFDAATRALRRGQAIQSQAQASRAFQKYRESNPPWAWKFKILEAQSALERGLNEEVLKILATQGLPSDKPELAIPGLMLSGIANSNRHDFGAAERALERATRLCEASPLPDCGYVLQAKGLLASERSDSNAAETFFRNAADFARAHGDAFLESNALLNLGAESLSQARFDEALDRSEAANRLAQAADAGILDLVTRGNIGWAYYKLGDADRALEQFNFAEKKAEELGDVADQGVWLTNAGYVYLDARNFPLAEQNFRRALEIESSPGVNNQQHTYNALRVLARLSLQTGSLDHASEYAARAVALARNRANRADELFPVLIQGQVAFRRGDAAVAEKTFREVELDSACPVFLKWEAQHALAGLYENRGQAVAADREYRLALSTFEAARSEVQRQDFQLSFLTNGWRIYDDYVHFLVAQGKAEEALRWADQSRARTLSEGFRTTGRNESAPFRPLRAPALAARNGGTILYYWLGESQSYLWAINARQVRLFTLPPAAEIDAAAQRYRAALTGPQDVSDYGDADGLWLYRTLAAPAEPLLSRDAAVFVIADGSLHNLNFETLLAPAPKIHYWIEDVTVANASSLRALGNARGRGKGPRRLLILGNSVPPSDRFPALPRAGAQMEAVEKHFDARDREVLAGASATPAAYLASHPEKFTHLHFVAHGTASRLSPLDSAIILSRSSADRESYKLYARDIIQRPLAAELVTISSCYGTGERSFKGEGLVGLSWAFLRAGAHNVIAALWEAADTPTEQLMSRFYDEMDRGATPGTALRTAKLSLLKSEGLRNPFYWAPFQLYTQGGDSGLPARYASPRAINPARMPSTTTTP